MSGDAIDSFRHSSPMERTRKLIKSEKQGIGTILRSDSERFRVAASLRRTLSADMSSERWPSQQSLFPIKKTASSAEISVSTPDSSSDDDDYEERRGEFDIWREIQEKKVKEAEKPGQFEVWSSILSRKVEEEFQSLPLYIHPLVKRSSSSLSEKSLEICTESLGSETGSDGFSSNPESENGDIEDEKKESPENEKKELLESEKKESPENEGQSFSGEEWTPKYNYRKSPGRSFPPPLSTLSSSDGDSVRMQSRRDNGRLVLEAVSVPSQCNLLAKRQDGRLVLSFVKSNEFIEEFEINDEDEEEDDLEEQFSDSDDHEEEEEEVEEEEEDAEQEENQMNNNKIRVPAIEIAREQPPKFSTGFLNIHRLARSVNKSTGFSNMNGAWTNKEEEKAEQPWLHPMVQSLPPRPQATLRAPSPAAQSVAEMVATSLNDCEYPWRSNPGDSNQGKGLSTIKQQSPPTKNNWSNVLIAKNGRRNYDEEKLNPFSNGCKQPKRSLLWEPHCIATS